ncbi:MAG TPA: AAA family ATPase [Geminicoccaceae bacterium]|nr:AAA family ATPase [Geminicoccaceae bacterium]
MRNLDEWLKGIGLGEHASLLAENDIDLDVLTELTDEDLRELGLSLGHRKRLLKAIRELGGTDTGEAATGEPATAAPLPWPTAAVRPPAPPLEAERRHLTVMFVDLVGSTELSRGLDPEQLRDIIRAYQNAVAGEITRFEGHIAKYMGDGVLAYFGWPRAHEDAAERAVRAGLATVEAVGRLVAPDDRPLAARVGIATGLVVVGDLIGEGAAREETVVGDTPNLAARLQTLAEPGRVVIADVTARLLGRMFDLVELDRPRLKGFADGAQAFQVLRESPTESRFEAFRAARMAPLVGREQELGLLLERWRLARSGEGQVVQLQGEPGIGKSRLLDELRERLVGEQCARLRYYCSSYHSRSTLYPVIQQLRRAAGIERDDAPGEQLDKLERLLARGGGRLDETVPLLAALLTVPTGGRYPPLELTPQRQKNRTFDVLIEQLAGLATEGPVLMLLEDIHWMDPTSLELFDLTVDRIERLPVLLVTTSRPDCPPRWTHYPHVMLLTLNRLGRSHAAAIVEGMTGAEKLPPQLFEHVLARTDGVPLFVEELTKAVLEAGLLRDAAAGYAAVDRLAPLAIPATLQDSLMARLDRLAPVKEVAQIGAVIGREFSHELLAAVATLPEPELDTALDQLVASELVFRRGTPPRITYSFKHALVQDAAYASLLRSRRQLLHARIAGALEDRFPDTVQTQPELLAHHCAQAGSVEKAVEYWERAGRLAMSRSAHAEAIAHLEAGLRDLLTLPEGVERDRQELSIRLTMGSAFVAAHGFAAPETEEAYQRARGLCERLDERRLLFPVLYGLCLFHLYAAEIDGARDASARLLELAATSNDRGSHFFAHRAAGVAAYPAGLFPEARHHLERALALYDPHEHRAPIFVYAFDPCVVCLDYLARVLFPLGLVDEAFQRNDQATDEARHLGHRNSLALPLFFGGTLRQLAGERTAVQDRAEELVRLAREEGFRLWTAGGAILQGWVAADAGDRAHGTRVMRDGIREWRATGAEFMVPYFLGVLAETLIAAGQAADALGLLAEAGERVGRSGERWFEAEVHRISGEAHLASREPDEGAAEACFARALETARRQAALLWELRAATGLGRLWRRQGKRAQIHALLSPLCEGFTEGSATRDLRAARELLGPTTSSPAA